MARDDVLVLRADSPEDAEQEEEEEELVDPLDTLKEKCGETKICSALSEKLQECNDRVNSRTKTSETCAEELFDYIHCVDHCLQETLFSKLK